MATEQLDKWLGMDLRYANLGIYGPTGRSLYTIRCPKILNWLMSCDKSMWENVKIKASSIDIDLDYYTLTRELEVMLELKFSE